MFQEEIVVAGLQFAVDPVEPASGRARLLVREASHCRREPLLLRRHIHTRAIQYIRFLKARPNGFLLIRVEKEWVHVEVEQALVGCLFF